MDIDQVLRTHGRNELVRKHLHVAGKYDETALVFADQRELLLFRFGLVLFRDRYDEVGDAIEVRDPLIVRMVGNNQRNFAMQFAALVR